MLQIKKLKIPSGVKNSIEIKASSLDVEDWTFGDWKYGNLGQTEAWPKDTIDFFRIARTTLSEDGFLIFSIRNCVEPEIASAFVTSILSFWGEPIKVFDKIPSFWRPLGVNPSRPPNRSGGVGISPLHLDFVNAENPPEYVCLFCLRPDPMNGGKSVVSDIVEAVRGLDDSERQTLRELKVHDGKVENLSHVGKDINPFSIISEIGPLMYRYTDHFSDKRYLQKEQAEVVSKLSFRLKQNRIVFMLERGDLLILDQRRVLHGREALGPNQAQIAESHRRLLMHSFVRNKNHE